MISRFIQDRESFSLAVVIPNRNDSKYLPQCIRSIVSQEMKPDGWRRRSLAQKGLERLAGFFAEQY